MSSSLTDRIESARQNGVQIRTALSASPPAHQPCGVHAALADYRDDILSAIRRGWTVTRLSAVIVDAGVAFSRQAIAKAVDGIVDDAMRDALAAGAKPPGAIKKIFGFDITSANAQVKTRMLRRINRLTQSRSSKTSRS